MDFETVTPIVSKPKVCGLCYETGVIYHQLGGDPLTYEIETCECKRK